jgi:hypothetical protein
MKDQPDNLTENMRKPTRSTEACMHTLIQQLNSEKNKFLKGKKERRVSKHISLEMIHVMKRGGRTATNYEHTTKKK